MSDRAESLETLVLTAGFGRGLYHMNNQVVTLFNPCITLLLPVTR